MVDTPAYTSISDFNILSAIVWLSITLHTYVSNKRDITKIPQQNRERENAVHRKCVTDNTINTSSQCKWGSLRIDVEISCYFYMNDWLFIRCCYCSLELFSSNKYTHICFLSQGHAPHHLNWLKNFGVWRKCSTWGTAINTCVMHSYFLFLFYF